MATITITRNEHDAAGFRRAAAASRDADAARRILAPALVLDGASRADVARVCGLDRQTLRDWVHPYNDEGLAGLSDRRGAVGLRPRLSPEQAAVVAVLVRAGPDPAVHGVVRWRRANLATVIAARVAARPGGGCRMTFLPGRRSTTTCAAGGARAYGSASTMPFWSLTVSARGARPVLRRRSSTANRCAPPIEKGLSRL